MADVKITALTVLTAADPINDAIPIVDVSNISMAASGTTSRISINNILSSSPTASGALTVTGLVTAGSATITGDLTVDTSTLKVDSTNDRVGIGTATPNYILDISGATPRLHIKDNGTGSSLVDIENNAGTLYVGRENSTGSGGLSGVPYAGIMYLQGAYPLVFGTNFIERARLNSTGAFVLAGGTTTANGIGVAFPTTQSASSDANCLDDYEEGTWTPVVADATTGGNVGTCSINGATYTKIGRQVSVQTYISAINTTGMTGANAFRIRGFPFAAVRGGNGNFYSYRVGRNASTVSSSVVISDGDSNVYFPLYTTNSATADLFITVAEIVSGISEITLSVTYFV